MAGSQPPLWVCPKCGHSFVTANLWHSCSQYELDDHFLDKDPSVRGLFDDLAAVIQSFGPVEIYAQKTRIVFTVRVRFVAAMPKKHWLDGHIWLKRRADDPHFHRIELLPPTNFIHNFRLTNPAQIDEEFVALLMESYRVGCQEIQ
jgi:hypothetical protein